MEEVAGDCRQGPLTLPVLSKDSPVRSHSPSKAEDGAHTAAPEAVLDPEVPDSASSLARTLLSDPKALTASSSPGPAVFKAGTCPRQTRGLGPKQSALKLTRYLKSGFPPETEPRCV